ncbi:hypothetical protein TIFTF001_054769 [Ficus carica]|uniref:Retrotransposon gag domain-containing protein n=1 Tax=Ficus carica TaxID=3494 RepID=A0AA88JHJ3_FICCA|nr:hypothetical protein TIFTF001_054769 [Ficus carica]
MFSSMMLSKFSCVIPTCTRTGLVHGLSWIGLAAPTTPWLRTTVVLAERKLMTYVYAVDPRRMDKDRDAALLFYGMQPLIFDGTRRTVSLAGWLYDMEMIFRMCHIEARLQVLLASRCLARDARVWWMTLEEPAMPEGTWVNFRALITAHYGPLPNEDANMPYRDPEIYNDMYLGRYRSYVADWRA